MNDHAPRLTDDVCEMPGCKCRASGEPCDHTPQAEPAKFSPLRQEVFESLREAQSNMRQYRRIIKEQELLIDELRMEIVDLKRRQGDVASMYGSFV